MKITGNKLDRKGKVVILKNCVLFPGCITELNNIEIDNVKNLLVVMSKYLLMRYIIRIEKPQESYGHILEMNQMIKKKALHHLSSNRDLQAIIVLIVLQMHK